MTQNDFLEGMANIDSDIVEAYVRLDSALEQKKAKKKPALVGILSLAACICLIIGALITFPLLLKFVRSRVQAPMDNEPPATYTPITLDEMLHPGMISGSSLEFIVGSSQNSLGAGGAEAAPPKFEFRCTSSFIVKATVSECRDDIYCELDVLSDRKPREYRLILMKTEEVISGEGVPAYFLYLMPKHLFTDMSIYESLIISMKQIGTEHYTLRNVTQNQVEAAYAPVFGDYQDLPELGNIIAFSNGVFDERLWQTESWIYGYQFARFYLENPQSGDLVVSRGASESDTIKEIKSRISESYDAPKVIRLNFESEDAKKAFEYVKPFENGVFSQRIEMYSGSPKVIFTRYINGCQTEETVTFDLSDAEWKVTRSDVSYSKEELGKLENIAARISEKAKEYETKLPVPPHVDPEGKKLVCLNLYGWYAKSDDKIYGIIKTTWIYLEYKEEYRIIKYYDDSYTLYDIGSETMREISRDELATIFGPRNLYKGEYAGEELPQ